MFDHAAIDLKPFWFAVRMVVRVSLFHAAAALADEKLRQIALMAVITGDEGIEGFDPVDQAEPGQKVERAVDGRRFGAAAIRFEAVEQIISFHRAAIFDHKLKHMLS